MRENFKKHMTQWVDAYDTFDFEAASAIEDYADVNDRPHIVAALCDQWEEYRHVPPILYYILVGWFTALGCVEEYDISEEVYTLLEMLDPAGFQDESE